MNPSSQPAVYRWQPAGWLRASGADAFGFLQGQFTNDLRASGSGTVYGLWLNVKGKVLADSFVSPAGEPAVYWIGSYFSPAATIRERLESHIIADDVTLEDQTADWAAVTVIGAGAAEHVRAARAGGNAPGVVFAGRRSRDENVEWVFPREATEMVLAALGPLPPVPASEMERRRIEAGIPAVPRDLGPADLPNEAGLEADAISYAKGCYLGQEVMARLKAMGQVRRRLLRVGSTLAPPAELPRPLFAGARPAGELRSAAAAAAGGFTGLAMVSLLHVAPHERRDGDVASPANQDTGPALALTADGEPVVHLLDAP